jgi:hypothetical protein
MEKTAKIPGFPLNPGPFVQNPASSRFSSLLRLKRLIKRNRKGRKGDTKFAKKAVFFVSFA